jgi:hypothetical protein
VFSLAVAQVKLRLGIHFKESCQTPAMIKMVMRQYRMGNVSDINIQPLSIGEKDTGSSGIEKDVSSFRSNAYCKPVLRMQIYSKGIFFVVDE